MSAALRPSQFPAPPLRAKKLGKTRIPARDAAREANVIALSSASKGISNGRLGALIGGEKVGSQVKTGAVVLTPAEVSMLLPIGVASKTFCGLLRARLAEELALPETKGDVRTRLQLALVQIEGCLVLLGDLDAVDPDVALAG